MSEDSSGKRIGKYLKYQREKRQISIAALAEKAKLTPAYISRLEQGDYTSPSLEVIQQIAVALNMPLIAFLKKVGVITATGIDLPELAYYFHEKYQWPPEAIEDMELFFKLVEGKYKKEIGRCRKIHQKYWNMNSQK